MGGILRPLRVVGSAAAVLLGGFVVATLGAAAVYGSVRKSEDAKRRKSSLPCGACKGKGFYACKLCRGESTIQWSPLYDPVAINPCLCPTCDGKKVQRCLNCLGRGYA